MFLNISPTLEGFYVIFNLEGKLVQGEVSNDLMPSNVKEYTYQELEDIYFEDWYNYITQGISEDTKKEIKENLLIEEIANCPLLTYKDGCYYRLNETVSLPKDLVKLYVENQNNSTKIKSLDSFWYWCSLLPFEQKEMLNHWISKGQFLVTEEGMIVGYKNVIYQNTKFDEFVTEAYYKIKHKWKKNPYKYYINQTDTLNITKKEIGLSIGSLYNQGKVFTHSYNSESEGQPRLYYTVGQETAMSKKECDYTTETCGSGINFMDKEWIESNGKSYMGDGHTICILVAPNNIVSAPTESGYNKARSCAIYTVCEVKWKDGKIIEPEWSIIENASKEYSKESKIDIERFINTTFEDKNPKFIGLSKKEITERLIVTI